GRLRSAGRELPFDVEEYYDWTLAKFGGRSDGTAKCRYCPMVLTTLDFQVDHVEPLKQGGGAGLDNLDVCCPSCNRYKGGLTERGFITFRIMLRWMAGERTEREERDLIVEGAFTIQDAAEIKQRLNGPIAYHKSQRKGKEQELASRAGRN
ncbi:MAG: HNH endonuclease signature motif containing protein, partial [Mycobacteriales bacterium]